jgi:hypothetical protein
MPHAARPRIAERYPPRMDLDLQDLADMASDLVEGSITCPRPCTTRR